MLLSKCPILLSPVELYWFRSLTYHSDCNFMLSWSQKILAYLIVLFESNREIMSLLQVLMIWFLANQLILEIWCLFNLKRRFENVVIEFIISNLNDDFGLIFLWHILPEICAAGNNPSNRGTKCKIECVFWEIFSALIQSLPSFWLKIIKETLIVRKSRDKTIIRSNFRIRWFEDLWRT